MARVDRADAPAIALLGLLPGRVGLGKQPAGVEGDDVDVEPGLAEVMQDDLVLEAEAGGEHDPAVDLRAEATRRSPATATRKRAAERAGALPRVVRFRPPADGPRLASSASTSPPPAMRPPNSSTIRPVRGLSHSVGGDRRRQRDLDLADVVLRHHGRAAADGAPGSIALSIAATAPSACAAAMRTVTRRRPRAARRAARRSARDAARRDRALPPPRTARRRARRTARRRA